MWLQGFHSTLEFMCLFFNAFEVQTTEKRIRCSLKTQQMEWSLTAKKKQKQTNSAKYLWVYQYSRSILNVYGVSQPRKFVFADDILLYYGLSVSRCVKCAHDINDANLCKIQIAEFKCWYNKSLWFKAQFCDLFFLFINRSTRSSAQSDSK